MNPPIPKRRINQRALSRLFLTIWTAIVVIFSFLPGNTKLAIGTTTPDRVYAHAETKDLPHRALHIAVFGLMELFVALAARNSFQSRIGFVATLLFGTLIEIAQHLVFGSVLEWWDIRDDAAGVFIVFSLAWVFRFNEA